MARWAVGVRMARPDAPAVRCALEQGRIVRMHLLRPTWHLVAREDVRWMLRLCAPRIRAANDSYARGQGLALDERLFRRAHGAIARALEGGQAFTREEIGALLAGEGFPSDTCAVRRILMRGETDGVLCSGPDRGRNPTYALLDERVPAGAPCPEGDDALALLALRYFGSHAPATLADFVWWSGLPAPRSAPGRMAGRGRAGGGDFRPVRRNLDRVPFVSGCDGCSFGRTSAPGLRRIPDRLPAAEPCARSAPLRRCLQRMGHLPARDPFGRPRGGQLDASALAKGGAGNRNFPRRTGHSRLPAFGRCRPLLHL